jgi:WD40 repeat protein/DNA-binding SARP family transcriptional activator
MDFLILGPLEVRGDRGAVALRGSKPRAVLAMLLLHANEPVSAERLALALWGEEAPHGAAKTVQVHVSRLRSALGEADVVTTTAMGYRLRVRPGELDCERFGRLVDDGRRALADGQPERAAALLREALALWRGPPLADPAFERFAAPEIARLEEQRLTALEARIEADLDLGRHVEVVGELQRLVAEHPARERLAAALMLALYRSGRQADALAVYRDAHRILVEEVGVQPGPELRHRQEAILRQDRALELRPAVAALPPELDASRAPSLVGRRDELAWLRLRWERARAGSGGLVTVTGASGSGKLRLAAELAATVHDGGADVLYATGSDPTDAFALALRSISATTRPTLLVIRAADRADCAALAELSRALGDLPVLVLACCEDVEPLASLRSDGTLVLDALDAAAVGAIARHYARHTDAEDVPADWLLELSGGVPRAIHEVASQWAQREATLRVGAVAGRAATGREQLRSIQAELIGGVEDLQEVRERIAPRGWDAPVVCPFKGLASFDVADAQYFFGRERLVAELVARLVGARLLGIVGPSGSGKSSVTRAGLLPALASGVLPGSETWQQALIRPGAHPLRELTDAMAAIAGSERAVIAVDQFEETFTSCEDEAERDAFMSRLGRIADEHDGGRVVLVVLRADFYGRCAAYPRLAAQLAANHVLVGPMQRDELRRAITLPAQRVGLRVDPELADALVADVKDEAGGLPLLSTALLELWQRRDGQRLRHTVYQQTGGVRGAVARLAEDAFGQLDEQQQALARGVLMRLAGESAAGGVERRRVALAELGTDADGDVAHVVALLTDRRLLTASSGTIELAHEALMREWPRLRDWIDADREGLRIHRNLNAAAREWEELGRDEGALYRGARLTEATEWNDAQRARLNATEHAFLQASEARQRLERTQRRRRIRLALGGLSAAVVLISAVALVAILQSIEAGRQRDIAASRGLAESAANELSVDPAVSLVLALRALGRADTEQAENALRQATLTSRTLDVWPTHRAIARALSVSRDGLTVATGGDDGAVAVRRIDTGRLRSFTRPGSRAVVGIALSPDGRRVAASRDDGTVIVSDDDGRSPRTVLRLGDTTVAKYGSPNYGVCASFSDDGRRLAIGALDGTVRLLRADGAGPVTVLRGGDGQVLDVAFGRDERRLVSTSYGAARVWDVQSAKALVLTHAEARSASFSPDDRRIATTGQDGVVRLWSADGSGRSRAIRIGQPLLSVRFSRDGRRLVTAAEDGVVRISDVRGGPVLDELVRHRGAATRAAFVARGQVVSTGEDGIVRRWDPPRAAILPGDYVSASFSPAGDRVLTGGSDGRTRVQDPATGATVATLATDTDATTARYSADGRQVVTASLDGAVRIADPRGGRSRMIVGPDAAAAKTAADLDPGARRIVSGGYNALAVVQAVSGEGRPVVLRGGRDALADVRFSRDGRHVLTASVDGRTRIWNPASGRLERTLVGHGESVNSAQYSPDATRIVTAGADGTVRVWPADGRGEAVVLRGHDGPVDAAAFSPDGTRIVSAGVDGTVRVWNAAGGATLVVLYTHDGPALSASFSADGTAVVSTGQDDHIARVTPCEVCGSLQDVRRLARTRAARPLDLTERQRFLPEEG